MNNKFYQIAFILVFFGSIGYLLYAFNSIDPIVKADAREIMLERRKVIEDRCKFITEMPERYDCFFASAQSLKNKIKQELASALFMYVNSFELNLSNSVQKSEQYQVWRAKLILDIHRYYELDSKYLKKLNPEKLKSLSEKLELS
tara:strand:- start:32622 stop:33056 length:435 start_codon:yes stop_codon:yes gene_type:complete